MSSIGNVVRRASVVSLIAASAALTLGVGAAAASTDKPPYDPKSIVMVEPGPIPAIVAVDPGPVPAIAQADPTPIPALTDPGKPPYDPKS